MSPKPLLEFKHASVGFGRRAVVGGVNLPVHRGEFLGILGPNGAGKTTILKTLLGLIPHLKGQFHTDGAAGGRPLYGYVPQKEELDAIYPLSVFEVAAMGTYRKVELFRRLRGAAAGDWVRRCLKQCGALELEHRCYSALSGGQRQRVLIARALAARPELLVLDEPLAGIDVSTQKALLKLFGELKAGGLTILMVSHRLQAEQALFTHLAWVDEGRLVHGPVKDMVKLPQIHDFFGMEPL